MAKKQVQEVDVLITQESINRAAALSKKFGEADKEIKAVLQSLQSMDAALKALRGAQIFGSAARTRNFISGSTNQSEVGVKRTAAGGESRNIALANQLVRAERERDALELSRSRRLTNNLAQIQRITSLEEANFKIRAAELRLGEALANQDKRKIDNARALLQNLEARRKAIVEQQKAEEAAMKAAKEAAVIAERARKEAERRAEAARREAEATARRNSIEEKMIQRNVSREAERRAVAAERAAKAAEREAAALEKKRMQPVTDRMNAQRSRELTEMRLFGDGGASLLKIQAGLMMNYTIINSITGAFGMAVSESIKFDASLRDLQSIVQVSDGGLEKLKGRLIDVANESKYTANEVASASIILGQAGFSNNQIEAAIGSVMRLATATGTDLSRAVDISTSVIGIFNMEAERMTHVADALTQAMNSSKLDIEKLTLGIQYAGNTAYDAGVSFEELTSGLGAMANAGIRSGSTLGTGMRQILVSLEKPSETFQNNLSKLGLSMNDVNLKTKGLYGVMRTLKDAGFSASDAIESFEVRSAAAFIALSNNLDIMRDMETSLYRTAAATQASETQMRSLDAQFKRFNGALSTVVYQAIEPMIYALRDVVSGVSDFLSALSGSPETLRTVGTALTALLAGFAGFKVLTLVSGLLKLIPADLNMITRANAAATISNNTFVLSIKAIRTELLVSAIGLRSFAAGAVGIGTAANAAFIGIRALLTGIGLIGPIIGAVTLAFSAFSMATTSFDREVNKSKDQIDMWRSRVEAARGVTDSFKAKVGEVEVKIKSLYGRFTELNKSTAALKAEVDRVRVQFSGMGSTVDGTETSVDQLITKLGELWLTLQKQYILRIGIEVQNLEGLLSIQQVQFNQSLSAFQEKMKAGFSTGDPTADKLLTDYNNATSETDRMDAKKAFDARIAELSNMSNTGEDQRMAETSVRQQFQIPDNANLYDAMLGKGYNQEDVNFLIETRRQSILNDVTAKVNAGVSVQQDLANLGNQELQILQTQEGLNQKQTAATEAKARADAKPLFDDVAKAGLDIDRVLRENENRLKNDPVGLYQTNSMYAELIRGRADEQIAQIRSSGLPEAVQNDLIAGINENLGKLGIVDTTQFEAYKAQNDLIGKRATANTNREYSNAVADVRTGNTEADVNRNTQTALAVAKQRMEEAKAQLKTQIPRGESMSDPKWEALAFEIEQAYQNDVAQITDVQREAIEGIRSGMGGANAAAKKDFNEFIDNLQTSDTQAKTALDIGQGTQKTTVDTLIKNAQTAQARLDSITPLVNQMTPLAQAGRLNAEEQATYKRLVSEQDQLRNYIKNTADDAVRIANDKEATYGFNTARKQDFESLVNGYEDRLQQIENDVTLKAKTPEQAVTARANIGNEIRSRISAIDTELAPLRAKVDSGVGLTAAEDAVFRQAGNEKNRLVDLLRGTSDLNSGGAGGGGGGAKGDTPFETLMKQLEGQFGDAQRGLGMETLGPADAIDQMQTVVDKAREELALRQQTISTMVPGSKQYNDLKEEERQLTDLILQKEEEIKSVKEEQGMAQINLLQSVRDWARANLDIGRGLETGFISVLDSMKSGLSTLFGDLMSGTKTAKEAFRDFAMSVVQSIQNVIAEMMAMYIMKKILGIFDMTMTGGGTPSIVPSMRGGAVRMAAGGTVEGTLARDSKLHMLMPGEYVLRASAARAIGYEALDRLNAMGNNRMASGGHYGVAGQPKGPLGMTNVYVVAPEQQPVPGPADIIAVINDDISRGGNTKRLIKTVAMGY